MGSEFPSERISHWPSGRNPYNYEYPYHLEPREKKTPSGKEVDNNDGMKTKLARFHQDNK